MLRDASTFVRTGLTLEAALAGAYLAATGQLAELGQPVLAATVATLAASEAQHLTLLNHLAGFAPHDRDLSLQPYRRASDAEPVLATFLARGVGLIGPIGLIW